MVQGGRNWGRRNTMAQSNRPNFVIIITHVFGTKSVWNFWSLARFERHFPSALTKRKDKAEKQSSASVKFHQNLKA